MGAALKFRHSEILRQSAELGRLKVISGPDFGSTFVLTGARVSLGRGDENDVILSDLKTSRKHAEIVRTSQGWQVRDLNSANGILLNGRAEQSGSLVTGDTLVLGETTLEFVASEAGTALLSAPPRSLSQVQAEQNAFAAQQARVHAMGKVSAVPPSVVGVKTTGNSGRSRLIMIVLAGAAALLLLVDSDPAPKKKKPKPGNAAEADLSQYLPDEDLPLDRTAETFFRSGFRELRERNYLRAKTQFETVLQMSPNHTLAALYLRQCETAIKEEVQSHLDNAKKSLSAGRTKDARAHFEAVLRLYHRDTAHPDFAEALDQLRLLEPRRSSERNVAGGRR